MKKKSFNKETVQVNNRIASKNYILFFLVIALFGFIITKNVSLPHAVTLPLAIAGVAILLFSAISRPQLPLLLLIAYLPFSKVLIGQFGSEIVGLNLSNILLIIVLFVWLGSAFSNGERVWNKSTLNPVIVLFCLWGFISVLRAKYMYGSAYDLENFFILFKRWLAPILLYFISFNMIKDKRTFKYVMLIMLTATFIIALMAIRDYMNVGNSSSMEESRVGGVFDQSNILGAFFVYNMFFFIAFFLYYWRNFKYWMLIVPFLACFRGIMVTFSRGAYLAFGFGALMTAFFRGKAPFICMLIFFICAVFIPGVLPEGVRYRLASTFGGDKEMSADIGKVTDSSATNRILMWKGALEMIKEQPLFGFGYGVFPFVIGAYTPNLQITDAHNTYLIIAAEMGIPALLIFIWIIFLMIKNAYWLLKHTQDRYFKAFALGALGGLFGLLLANMFGSRLNSEEVSSYFWIMAGLIMAAVRMVKLEKRVT